MISGEIFIVDDDYDMRDALTAILRRAGFYTAAFTDGRSFVRLARDQRPVCVLLDQYMPGQCGVDVLKEIDAKSYPAPILILSGRGDVLTVVQAMRNGAFDYLEKQLDPETIVARIYEAIEAWQQSRERYHPAPLMYSTIPGYHKLTRHEREVLSYIAAAATNKETAMNLAISPRTVEVHRGRIMDKLGAKNSVDLMRILMSDDGRHHESPEMAPALSP